MKRLLLLLALLTSTPVFAGDLGLFDDFLYGVNANGINLQQREFGGHFADLIFTEKSLSFEIGERHGRRYFSKNKRFEKYLVEPIQGSIKPDQVLNLSYMRDNGLIVFTILYVSLNG